MSIGIADLHFDRCPSTSCTVCHGSQLQTCQFRTEFNLMKVNLINGCRWHMALRDGWRVASYFFGRGCPTQPSLWILHIVCYLTGPVPWLLCPVELRFFRQRFIWLLGSSSWAVELVGTLMEFLWRRFMWLLNLRFFFPAIYVVAGPGDSHIGTTDRRFDLHSPLSLVSKKVRDLRHFIVLEEHVAFKIVWQWKPFWWTDGLSLNVLENFWRNGLVWTHLCLG